MRAWIYFVRSGSDGAIKIGRTAEPICRIGILGGGSPVNPKDPVDRMHAQRWLQWYRDLAKENARGTLTLVHKDPSFARTLSDAINASRIESATREGDQRYADASRAKHQAMSDGAMWQDMILSRRTSQVAAWPYWITD